MFRSSDFEWTAQQFGVVLSTSQSFDFYIGGKPFELKKMDDGQVKLYFPEDDLEEWFDFDEFEDFPVEGDLSDRLNDVVADSLGDKWSRGWSESQYRIRFPSHTASARSLTQGIWGVRREASGHVLTHLPSGESVHLGLEKSKHAKKLAYCYEQTSTLTNETFRPRFCPIPAEWAADKHAEAIIEAIEQAKP